MKPHDPSDSISTLSGRRPLALLIAGALLLVPAGALWAQDNEEDDSSGQVEEVVVTGTRKEGRLATETLSPVDIIGGSALTSQGSLDLTDSLTKVAPSLNTQRFPIADGTAFVRPVTLRNLAPDQTLVLVDGSRRHRSALVNLQIAPLGTVNQGSQAVDFAALPSSAIKRVEILRDGASAQYGSDAIAGVINVILKDNNDGLSFDLQRGEYFEGDGERTNIYGNAGFSLGSNGFLSLSVEHSESEITSRGQARPDAAQIAEIVGASQVPYNGLGQRWGDPDIEATKLFANLGVDISDNVELFGHASYMDSETIGGFFYRGPVVDPQYMIAARATLQFDGNGDFLPDPAPQGLINSIMGSGLNPADYFVADASSPSGYVLRNPIHTMFPGGYSPLFGADIKDHSVVFGVRGSNDNNLSWEVRGRTAENEVSYTLVDSINPSLGSLSPTTFNPGTLTQEETGFNVDFVRTFDDSPLNLAFGFEWRNETYKIGMGDQGSTEVGPAFTIFGVGSDGFQGYSAEQAGKWEKDSTAAYIDLESDITDDFSGAVALRYEDHDFFGSTTDFKLSGRYQVNDDFALRGTVNTGFRVPTPGQVNTLNVTTSADSQGNLIPSGFYPVDHPVALALGAQPQQTEESQSITVGFVWEVTDRTSVTFDYYDIEIEDRIGTLDTTVSQAAVDTLVAQNYPNAELLLGTAASFFSNAFDSDVRGVDLVISTSWDVWGGALDMDLRHNQNDQDVKNIKPGTINASRAFDLENQVPDSNSVLSFSFARDRWDGLLRFNRYGGWETTGGIFSPGDASDVSTYGSEILVDLEANFRVNDYLTLGIGGENIFDTYPDPEQDGTFQFLGVVHSITSPFGFNGGFWYVKASVDFE